MKLTFVRLTLLVAGTLLISGCGGSDSKPAAETKPAAASGAEAKPAAGSTAKPKATKSVGKGKDKAADNADEDPRENRKKAQ